MDRVVIRGILREIKDECVVLLIKIDRLNKPEEAT